MASKSPVTIVMAIPDHPWTKATEKAAAVRIAMTVAEPGSRTGLLRTVVSENGLDTDQPEIELETRAGRINPDLTVGVDVTNLTSLESNKGLCTPGMQLSGQGFIVERAERDALLSIYGAKLDQIVKPYSNGRRLIQGRMDQFVIDAFPLQQDELRRQYPHVYELLADRVKPERDRNNRDTYRTNWWLFAEPRRDLRPAFAGLQRYIATTRTAKFRIFSFVHGTLIAESKIIAAANDDAMDLGVLSSRPHVIFSTRAGGWLGVGNDPTYNHTDCFDPFPFPTHDRDTASEIRAIAEELDKHRKDRQAEHPGLTLTDMYNVLEKLRGGVALDDDDRRIKDHGLVLMLKEYHDRLDAAVARAYGWPVDITDEQILERLVALNAERAEEEKNGRVRWLRPDYQIPRFGSAAEKARWQREQAGERPRSRRRAPGTGRDADGGRHVRHHRADRRRCRQTEVPDQRRDGRDRRRYDRVAGFIEAADADRSRPPLQGWQAERAPRAPCAGRAFAPRAPVVR